LHVRDALVLTVHRAGPSLAGLAALLRPPAWHADAACKEHPEVAFFPPLGETAEAARAVCAGCLVRVECLAAALEEPLTQGVWGGTTVAERKAMRRAAA
jgi:WhiB family redox-sensing transcriptional regulator